MNLAPPPFPRGAGPFFASHDYPRRMASDYVRICQACGARRTLTKDETKAKAPSAGKLRRIERAARISVGNSGYATQAMALRAQQDRFDQLDRCPGCGSRDHQDFKAGTEPAS